MPAGLLERLGARVTFVVGKGGVGKTTLAGGLALALADLGTGTHLLSVDPAHSVGDLFDVDLGPDPVASPCTDRLWLEELDAAALASDRLRTLTPGLRQLIERGTYLDLEDADSLLSAALPGLDEVGAALRIAALTSSRLVVDTAPTGHTLRLLETPGVVRGWLEVFDAMADKADTVASALLGRDVRLSVESELETLAEDVAAFEEVVRGADFVLVTGAGRVVAAETERLLQALEERDLRVVATAAVERPGAVADIRLSHRPGLQGCGALRSWWREGVQPAEGNGAGPRPSEPEPIGETRAPGPEPELRPLLDRELVVFAGKGGVGKTTCAAAASVYLAGEESVRLQSADPAGSLDDVLAGQEVEGLRVEELAAARELDRLKTLYEEKVERVFEAVGLDRAAALDRAVVESLWKLAPPGIDEVMAVARLADDAADARIVLDTAPTGHFLRLVGMPELALDWVHRTLRILLKYHVTGGDDSPAEGLLRFAKRFRALQDRLMDPDRTAIVVVTLEEPLVRDETSRLADRLRGLDLPLAGVIVNRATGAVRPRDGVPTWRAPEVAEPHGPTRLRAFIREWERVT